MTYIYIYRRQALWVMNKLWKKKLWKNMFFDLSLDFAKIILTKLIKCHILLRCLYRNVVDLNGFGSIFFYAVTGKWWGGAFLWHF